MASLSSSGFYFFFFFFLRAVFGQNAPPACKLKLVQFLATLALFAVCICGVVDFEKKTDPGLGWSCRVLGSIANNKAVALWVSQGK